ncbi:MAG: SO2930 family diheme c-type cytochrome [Cyclobacteriaceae bacterium]
MRLLVVLLLVGLVACSRKSEKKQITVKEVSLGTTDDLGAPKRLSDWNLFEQPLANLSPEKDVIPYDLNTPLFTDYAHKARFVKLPEGTTAKYNPVEVMDFPEGTILIKNFYYPIDFSQPEGDRRIIETRLLINEPKGWNALVYVWNEKQTDAELKIAGKNVPVSWTDEKGVLRNVKYSVPNLVQCKSCHELSGEMSPIGPTARQLNRSYSYADGSNNQLSKWASLGILSAIPPESEWPIIPVWDDETTGTLDARARAWLEINCAHCHRAVGPAKNTGLYLTYAETDLYKLGLNKPPVAAGRGSGGLKFGIVPGQPDQSILYHRISSTDPGVMMPELGRKMNHDEGITLIREWIAEM